MILSSFQKSPGTRFEGYCFVGPDFVVGEAGREAYERVHNTSLSPGEDGCYVVATPTPRGWEVGTDAHGTAKLFMYDRGGVWAIGTSLVELADHLRSHGVTLEPHAPALRGLGIHTSLTNQMISRQTIIQGIQLVPTYRSVRVMDSGIELKDIPSEPAVSYDEALSRYLELWRSRIRTLLNDEDARIAADITGGMDSRLVLAFLLESRAIDLPADRLRLVSSTKHARDFEVASVLAEVYGLELNGPKLADRTDLNPGTAFDSWRSTSLGVYMPVYFVERDFDPWAFQAHGAGGGNVRSAYAAGRGPDALDRFENHFTAEEFESWRASVDAELREYADVAPGLPMDVMHYRQFRGRLHFGHRPHRRSMYTPLNSAALDDVYAHVSHSAERQVYFDVMESLVPGLISHEYDVASKSPGKDALSALSRVPLSENPQAGAIYAPLLANDQAEQPSPRKSNAVQRWAESARAALAEPEIRDFLGEETTNGAEGLAAQVASSGKLPAANDADVLEMSLALAVEFAFRG